MNLTANLLGLGNAATPMGIEAMHALSEEHGGKRRQPRYGTIRSAQHGFTAIASYHIGGPACRGRFRTSL